MPTTSSLRFDDETADALMRIYQTEWAAGRRRAVREALAASAGERILDMGCGPGFYCSELAEDVGLSDASSVSI